MRSAARPLCQTKHRTAWVGLVLAALVWLVPSAPAAAQAPDLVDRPISSVQVVGLNRLTEREVRANLRVAPGQPYDPDAVRIDVDTLYRLGQFRTVTAEASLLDNGTVTVRYVVAEQAIIRGVQTVGNKVLSDQELRAVIPLFANAPRDDFLVERSIRNIKELYQKRGHFLTDVAVDESRLSTDGILIFEIVEGPRTKIKAITFEGNESFPAGELRSQIRTKTAFFLLQRGQIDQDQLLDDTASLDRFYRDRGFVDVRVDHRVELSPDNKEAKVVFVIAEGRQYRVRQVVVEGYSPAGSVPLQVMAPVQVRALMIVRPGDVYSQNLMRKSIEAIRDAYLVMGYLDVRVDQTSVRVGEAPEVDVIVGVTEGRPTRAGLVEIQGNYLTKDKVIRREVRIQPGRTIDGRELELSRQRLVRTRLFGNDVRITPQPPSQDDPEVSDVLVEVKEKNTGAISFGAAIGSDSGIFGEISLRQDNFDIADFPESFGEFVGGKAFRGAGQRFNLTLAPGNEVSTYSISFADPKLLDSEIGGALSGFYRQRIYDEYDEDQINLNAALSRRFGDLWSASAAFTWRRVELTNIEPFAAAAYFEDAGPNNLDTVSLSVTRNSIDRILRPTRGSNIEFGVGATGIAGGDRSYTSVRGEYTGFFTLDEDFLGRRSVLRLSTQAAYIFDDEAPVYDRFYLGGRSLRGFEFRTVSPKGLDRFGNQTDDPIGGNWLFFAGAQYEFPIFQQIVSGVVFVDSGTVLDDIGFDEYRVSVGVGLRLVVPAFGPTPIAVDFGFPILKEELDEDQLVSFSADIPF